MGDNFLTLLICVDVNFIAGNHKQPDANFIVNAKQIVYAFCIVNPETHQVSLAAMSNDYIRSLIEMDLVK